MWYVPIMETKADDKWDLILYLAQTRLGVKPGTAIKWKQRGSVPHKFRIDLLDIAAEGKLRLTREDLGT